MRLFRGHRKDTSRSPNETANYDIPVVSAEDFARQSTDLIAAEVRMISGCHSEQTSADVSNVGSVAHLPNPAGRSGGACTSALLEILYRHHHCQQQQQPLGGKKPLSFQQALLELRDSLAQRGLDQIPQLTSSRPLELDDTPFSLSSGQVGTSRALLVGINYIGQNGQLGGCHNDVWNVKKYLVEVQGFQEENILVLVDDGRNRHFPTRKNIIAALRQSVAQSMAGDSVYFHYSGTVELHMSTTRIMWASLKSAWIRSLSNFFTVTGLLVLFF
jgi:metacaspase-1